MHLHAEDSWFLTKEISWLLSILAYILETPSINLCKMGENIKSKETLVRNFVTWENEFSCPQGIDMIKLTCVANNHSCISSISSDN